MQAFRTANGLCSQPMCTITGPPPEVRESMAESLKGKRFIEAGQDQIDSALDYGGLVGA